MTTRGPVAPERLAEAGVWIAKLHGDERRRSLESGLRRWLQEDPENARAFELATEVWEDAEQLRRFVPFPPIQPVQPRRPRWQFVTAAVAMAMVLALIGVTWFQHVGVISTKVGEQRQLVLEDGTRVFLNTDTRIAVKYDVTTRRVELRRGEALFNVAKRTNWPFVVVAGDRQVLALGTSFVVRKEAQVMAVTLVEGRVSVSPVEPAATRAEIGSSKKQAGAGAMAEHTGDVFTLTPGQRLTFSADSGIKLDTPSVEITTAWRRGQVILDDTPLQAAAAEMNRYSSTKLIVQHPEAGALLINGLFQAGDSTHFAKAVAQAYGLEVIEQGDAIVLSGKPSP